MAALIHFALLHGSSVHPRCGDSSHARNWTTHPTAVTCPSCAELVRDPPDAGAAAADAVRATPRTACAARAR